ncbi:hypothetical protein [Streptomyces aidingensis]|uniref:hypothetical protein n=1 Tax=Streptomyces aidingensis TaxID=910347 RepID=UPI000B86E83B|nr:hypothetical protein [Streptomyces aidingensis]
MAASRTFDRAVMQGLMIGASAGLIVLTVLVMGVAMASGPQLYHAAFGERTEAVVTSNWKVTWSSRASGPTVTTESSHEYGVGPADCDGQIHYRVEETGTGRGLGLMYRGPGQCAPVGARLEVSVDPSGRVATVAADRLGHVALPGILLGGGLAGMFLLPAAAAMAEHRARPAAVAEHQARVAARREWNGWAEDESGREK